MLTRSPDDFEHFYNIPSYSIFTKTPNVSPANSFIQQHYHCNEEQQCSHTTEIRNRIRQNKSFSRTNKMPYKLLPDRWSLKSTDFNNPLEINGHKVGNNLHEEKEIFRVDKLNSVIPKPITVALSTFMPNNSDNNHPKPLKNPTINSQHTKTPLTTRRDTKDILHQSDISKEVDNTRYHCQTQQSTPPLNQQRQYGRTNLISGYRGESPPRRGRSETSSARTEHRGGLFNVHMNNRTKAPYYIIHPEWLSETMTICQLGLSPRPTPLPITNGLSDERTKKYNQINSPSPNHSSRSVCTDSGQSPLNRCKSLPPKTVNPITWNC
ncbi:unnamed protein product [Heterobilharzia americana]|nr:unnamed protein product [Heterobilharzia americana]